MKACGIFDACRLHVNGRSGVKEFSEEKATVNLQRC